MNPKTLLALDGFLTRKEEPNTYAKYLESNVARLEDISKVLQNYSASSQNAEDLDRFKDILSIRKYMQQYRSSNKASISSVRLEK